MFKSVSTIRSTDVFAHSVAGDLAALARGLEVNCGFERSFKLSPGSFDAARFLISLPTKQGRAWQGLVVRGLRQLGLPPAAEMAILATLPNAKFLHLGYQEPGGDPGLKAYLEFDPSTSEVVHRSYKWRPGAAMFVVDEYRRVAGLKRLAPVPAPFERAVAGFADMVAQLPPDEVFVLDVSRVGGGRRSFDMRLYGADLCLRDVMGLLEPVAVFCGCAPDWGQLMRERGQSVLGHVAAGIAGDGSPYLTVYYGAETLP